MELCKLKKKDKEIKKHTGNLESYVVHLYLLGMLGIFPLFTENKYNGIGDAKYNLFWKLTILFFILWAASAGAKQVIQFIFYRKQTEDIRKSPVSRLLEMIERLSWLDYAILIYGICVVLSYFFSDYKEFALFGAGGWQMGLYTQLILIADYFIISRRKLCWSFLLTVHMIGSAVTYVLGIFHRFQIDPLGMYEGLNLQQITEFLSTIGQATWFSSYICTGVALGVVVFYLRDELFAGMTCRKKQYLTILTAGYTVLAFGILVVQNSDSGFMALLGMILLLGYFSLGKMERWIKFTELMAFMCGTFGGIGILQRLFADRAVPLDTLSTFFSQSPVIWVLFGVSLVSFLSYRRAEAGRQMKRIRTAYKTGMGVLVFGILAAVLFICLNTAGILQEWFGIQVQHQYLLFDDAWGSYRGKIWKLCWQAYQELPFYQKLFGVGPDCLEAYLYNGSEIGTVLSSWLGSSMRLTNAHNEYLNSLLCYGAVGLIAWLTVLAGGIAYFCRRVKEEPYSIAFALCIISYALHNFFCYQQVCCTPFLFLFLGMGESLTKFSNLFISVYRE